MEDQFREGFPKYGKMQEFEYWNLDCAIYLICGIWLLEFCYNLRAQVNNFQQ
jgi:hypothetical protein